MATKKEKISFYGTGRRKKSIARVRLVNGNGNITVNNKPLDEFFGIETLKVIVKQPLVTTNSLDKFDVQRIQTSFKICWILNKRCKNERT